MAGKKFKNPSEFELAALQEEIEDQTAHLPAKKQMQLNELLSEVNSLHPGFNDHELRYMQKLQLVARRKAGNGNYYFGVKDLREVLFVCTLRDPEGKWGITSYSQIAGLMLQSQRKLLEDAHEASKASEVPVSPNQQERGILFWRGSLVRYFLLYIFSSKVPPLTKVFLFKPRHRISETQPNEKQPAWMKIEGCDYPGVDYRLEKRDFTLITAENGEVFHSRDGNLDLEELQNEKWYRIEGGGRTNPVDYEIILAVPSHQPWPAPLPPDDHQTRRLLLSLIDGCFLDVDDIASKENGSVTSLDVVTGLVAKMSPAWRYCACFAPSLRTPERLITLSASKWFSQESRRMIQISVGQLLSGRAYNEGYSIVVQQAISEDDPRIAEDVATSAAAVPTLYNDRPNGALYVANRNPATTDQPFSDADIGLLRIFGLIAGQLLGQDEALRQSGRKSLAIIDDHRPEVHLWDKLEEYLTNSLTKLRTVDKAAAGKYSIQFIAVQLKNYDLLEAYSPEIAAWSVEQLQSSAVHYYLEQGAPPPLIFERSQREFLLFLPTVSSSDQYEQLVRRELRDRLNTLSLPISTGGGMRQIAVECDLWSLSFRHADLLRFDGGKNEEQVRSLIDTTAEAFKLLPYIRRGHEYEHEGAWAKALDEYKLANRLSPGNTYVLRHIAKAYTQLHEDKEAEHWWYKVLALRKHPSHYRRLARNLIAQGSKESQDDAIQQINEAIRLDNTDAKSHADAGSIYLLCEDYEAAIASLEMAALLDQDNAALYRLRIAEAYYRWGKFDEALRTCTIARTYQPDNRDIPFMVMKISRAMNSVESGT